MEKRYRRIYDDQKPGMVWHQEFSEGRSLNQKLKMKISKLGDVRKLTSLTQTYHRWRSGGEAPSRWAIFCNFLEKKLFQCLWITFRMCSEPFEKTRFLTFESQLKKIILF